MHEDHVADRGVHFVPINQAMNISATETAVDKEWEYFTNRPVWDTSKVESEHDVIKEAIANHRQAHFATLMDLCHLSSHFGSSHFGSSHFGSSEIPSSLQGFTYCLFGVISPVSGACHDKWLFDSL